MFGLATQNDLEVPVNECPEVVAAREKEEQARHELQEAEAELNRIRQTSDSNYGPSLRVSELDRLEAKAMLPETIKAFTKAKRAHTEAHARLQDAREAAVAERTPALQKDLKEAMQELFEKLAEAEAASQRVGQVFEKANRQLIPGQREIPDLSLPYFNDDHGRRESQFAYQKNYYSKMGWL